jgi:NAD-dependent dihydropyrimidine dehydrogenase PreA subunit/DNA-binding transcriptional ArsR family regulator
MKEIGPYYETLAAKLSQSGVSSLDSIYLELAGMMGSKDSKYIPRILAKLASPEQARVIRELPAAAEEISAKLQMDKALVEKHLREMMEKGLVVITKRGARMVRNTLQLHDSATNNPKYEKLLGEEYLDLWAAYQLEEHFPALIDTLVGVGRGFAYSRIVPRWKSIQNIPGVLPCEDMRDIMKSQEVIALVPCPCKKGFQKRQCGVRDETCINVGRTAMYNLNRGVGRKLTPQEAIAFCDRTDEEPFVHIAINQKTVNMLVCNCHWCCCELILPLLRQDKYPLWRGLAKSRFEATVDSEECKGCGKCLERCQFGAVQMKEDSVSGLKKSFVDPEKCMGCGCCAVTCPTGARQMKLVRPPEHIPDVGPVVY